MDTENNTVKCAHCGAVRPIQEMEQKEIIYRRFTSLAHETNWYCKDKPCAHYDQMGHEG